MDFVRDNLRLELAQDQAQWRRLKKQYDLLLTKRELVRARLKKMVSESEGNPSGDVGAVMSTIKDLNDIEKQKMSLDVEIWRWDDRAWK